MNKYFKYGGILAAPWWLATIAIFGFFEPNYSHLYKAVSELGAFGAENPIAMNLVCLFTTGMLVIIGGLSFRMVLKENYLPQGAAISVVITGAMLAGTAIPADMQLYFESPWTVAHAFFVLFGVIPFAIAAWKTPKVLAELGVKSYFLSYFPLTIIPVFTMHGFVTQGGLVQRATILIVLVWVSYLCWVLYPYSNSHSNNGVSATV